MKREMMTGYRNIPSLDLKMNKQIIKSVLALIVYRNILYVTSMSTFQFLPLSFGIHIRMSSVYKNHILKLSEEIWS